MCANASLSVTHSSRAVQKGAACLPQISARSKMRVILLTSGDTLFLRCSGTDLAVLQPNPVFMFNYDIQRFNKV